MAHPGRPGLSYEQRRELWRRWKAGESLSEIGRALGRQASNVYAVLAPSGGYRPARRRRSQRVLSLAEREEISRGLAAGRSLREVARGLGRAPSTVSREVARHGGRRRYRALQADDRAWRRARRPKPCKLACEPRLRALVAAKLAQEWSPEQISGWLARTYPKEQALQVSTETIYRSLFVQARGVLRKELCAHLRTHRPIRRARSASTKGQGRGTIREAVSIRERPPEAQDRAVPGHWEGDLLAGSRNTYIATLVERQTRFLLLVRVKGRQTETYNPSGRRGRLAQLAGVGRSRPFGAEIHAPCRAPSARFGRVGSSREYTWSTSRVGHQVAVRWPGRSDRVFPVRQLRAL